MYSQLEERLSSIRWTLTPTVSVTCHRNVLRVVPESRLYSRKLGGHMSRRSNVISEKHLNGAGDSIMAEDRREELLTVREVARRLRVDDTTVRRWIKSGALEAITLPHRGKRQAYRIKKSTLDSLLNSSLPLT